MVFIVVDACPKDSIRSRGARSEPTEQELHEAWEKFRRVRSQKNTRERERKLRRKNEAKAAAATAAAKASNDTSKAVAEVPSKPMAAGSMDAASKSAAAAAKGAAVPSNP